MIRFCPNCQTERGLAEIFCEGTVNNSYCGWDLSREAMHQPGWRPQQVVTAEASTVVASSALICVNGHPMEAGDLMCMACGAEPAVQAAVDANVAQATNESAVDTATVVPSSAAMQTPTPPASETAGATAAETIIEGWRLIRQVSSTDGMRDRYLAEQLEGGRQGLLTLYHPGAEPDPSVYVVLQRLPRDFVPDIITTGRWQDRAFEVAEVMEGGTLADLGIVANNLAQIHEIVQEVGRALHAFSEAGLRHRDLRPGTLLVRSRTPLDLVISGFGSARLSDFDLDVVSPLGTTRYMAPEAVAGGVAAASDWWSLGMILLEQITQGACFEGINPHAFLIQVLAHGVILPDDLDPSLHLLLRGLLARDRHERWKWPQVQKWLNGEAVDAPSAAAETPDRDDGASITLAGKRYHQPARFALAAAEAIHWDEARDHLLRGVVVTWAQQASVPAKQLSGLRQVAQHDGLEDDFKLMLALKLLNTDMPLIQRGEIVTPGWLLEHALEGYRLITGHVPDLLEQLDTENWLLRLKTRAVQVRNRASSLGIALDEDTLRIHLLSTSRARLSAMWEERRRLLPDSQHPGILSLSDRRSISEEDLIVLLSAPIALFQSVEALVLQAAELARKEDVMAFDTAAASELAIHSRQELYRLIDDRIQGFARCGVASVDTWAEQFRIERRMPLVQALVLLAVPAEQWLEPQKQQYLAQILDFFEKKISTSVLRGPLVRMSIGKTTFRIDINELQTARRPASALLDHLLLRNAQDTDLDPAALLANPTLEPRLQGLYRHTSLYKRDTGIDGLYLGFPFLLTRDPRTNTRTRIAPVLLWPVKLLLELGRRGQAALAFDSDREEVRLNPALEGMIGLEATTRWRKATDELLGRSALKAGDVMDAFGMLATVRSRTLDVLPPASTEVVPHADELACAAVLFHVTFMGQAIGEDLRLLKAIPPAGTGLETALRISPRVDTPIVLQQPPEKERYLTVASDPSQEAAVLQARFAPGLLVEGPPGTGKSQTIVNMVADAIGRERSLLIVCQKQAALDVVRKRLVAEGLGERIVMINDVNKDREPVIRAVREQLEGLFSNGEQFLPEIRRQRERVAARIESLESELDRFHEGLHRIDERIGLSYRTLLGELIALEAGTAPLDVPALRSRLEAMDTSTLAALEESCAPLARYWLPARYEGNPLVQLQPFAPDRASLEAFHGAFQGFVTTESSRAQVLLSHPSTFEVDDPTPHRAWLDAHGAVFMKLEQSQRETLVRWLPLFRPLGQGMSRGQTLLVSLQQLQASLAACERGAYDPLLSPALALLSPVDLSTQLTNAAKATAPASWLGKLSPSRFFKRRSLSAFLVAHGDVASDSRMSALLAAARLEQQWRPLRAELGTLLATLALPALETDAGTAMSMRTADALHGVQGVADLADRLAAAPRVDHVDAAALAGTRDAIEGLLAGFDAAFARCEARRLSNEALKRLEPWFTAPWLTQCETAIARNDSNSAATGGINQALPTLAAYQQFRARAAQLTPDTLALFAILRDKQPQLEAIPAAQLETEVRRTLNREARLAWKRRYEQDDPALLLENTEAQAKITSLAAADAEMRGLNRRLLSEGIATDGVSLPKAWEDITRLTGKRSRRLREFIELGSELGLMKLRPVWLMNPDVASRVLPLKAAMFDSVIYDEASQMPVEFALPTLFRGRVTIVSGDEKQMPPTAFFSSRIESDEAESFDGDTPDDSASEEERETFEETWNRREIKDCPDLLQLARTALPVTTLQIHYRSAYRELIGFSNASFYGNRLSVPVRHPQSKILEVKPLELVRVDGLYENQTNPAEAAKVADLLAQLWQQPYAERPSVGVVTFNRKQADLIEEVLEARADQDEVFRAAYREERERIEHGEDMAVFVKNVENVQGDERDIIMFSSTFGRNAQGTFRRAFGVLGQTGGERRLNVAVTRARKKVVMVTSMPISDISDMLATQRQPASPRDFLQGYLEYARSLSAGEFPASRALLDRLVTQREVERRRLSTVPDGFSVAVADYVRSLGWRLANANEGDAFSLDYAIEDPTNGLYAIGIECDAPRHALLNRARAREIWRPSVLSRAIPTIHRVSSLGWYHAPEIERERLKMAISSAMKSQEAA